MEHKLIIKNFKLFKELESGNYFVLQNNNIVYQKYNLNSRLVLHEDPILESDCNEDELVFQVKPIKFEDNVLYYDYI